MTETRRDLQAHRWCEYVAGIGDRTDTPFSEHWAAFNQIYADRDSGLPPPPAWVPDANRRRHANISAMMRELGIDDYREFHRWTSVHREEFWGRVIERLGIEFTTPPERFLDLTGGVRQPRWLPGAELNITSSCFSQESELAVVSGREGSDDLTAVSSAELEQLAGRVAHGLRGLGLEPGAAVALYMPMNLQCVAAYLGIVRAGCAVVSIADSFAAPEVRRRLEIADAAAVITVDRFTRGGRTIRLYDTLRAAEAPTAIVLPTAGEGPPMLRSRDLLWEQFLADEAVFVAVASAPDAVTNILFSSGTTGDPKAIPWTQLTPVKCAMDGHFHHDIQRGDVVAWPTNIGWMMGPWLIYASLINRATIALFEGLPTGADFTRFVERAGVTMLGVVPSLVRAWRDSGACEDADWSRVRVFSSTGEPSNRHDSLWLMSRTGYRAPVIEYCGGTEIGGGHLTGTVVQPCSPATFSTPALGLELEILDEAGERVPVDGEGELFLRPPSIGLSQALLNRDHDAVYFDGCPTAPDGTTLRRHGDQVARLPGGYYRAQGRADDTMNLGGIKVSSLELERVVERHPEVFEAAAVAVQTEGEGAESLVIFAVLNRKREPSVLRQELGRAIASELNPLFKIHDLVIVDALPRTASNKLMRRELRAGYTR